MCNFVGCKDFLQLFYQYSAQIENHQIPHGVLLIHWLHQIIWTADPDAFFE